TNLERRQERDRALWIVEARARGERRRECPRVKRPEHIDDCETQRKAEDRAARRQAAGAVPPRGGEKHDKRRQEQLIKRVNEKERRGHDRGRQRDDEKARDSECDEEWWCGEHADGTPAPRPRVREQRRQVHGNQRRRDALLSHQELSAR